MRLTHLVTTCLLAAACGGKSEPAAPPEPVAPAPETKPSTPAPPPAPPAPPAKPGADGIVRLTASDQMQYSTRRIEAPAGKVKVELKNVGALPKTAMGHNFIVLKPGSDVTAFGMKAVSAMTTEYIPADAPEMIAHTKLLGPGESAILELELTAGTYPFLCSFPGHVALMNGELVAQ
jgi:azurin